MTRRPYLQTMIACVAIAVFAHWPSVVSAAGDIQHNPFSRPSVEKLTAPANVRAADSSDLWRAQLRAVLVADSKSLADLGGVILKVGESINGYRLDSVGEEWATFTKNGEPLMLYLYENESSEQQ